MHSGLMMWYGCRRLIVHSEKCGLSSSKRNKMPHCAAFGCNFQSKGNKESEVSLHSFPKARKIRKQWEDACERLELPQDPRLCSRHFSSDAFEAFHRPKLMRELIGASGCKRRLKPNAVPTIFPHKEPKRPRVTSENRANRHEKQQKLARWTDRLEEGQSASLVVAAVTEDSQFTVEKAPNTTWRSSRMSQRDAAQRLTQQEVVAAVMWDHDYAVNSAVFPEKQTLKGKSTPEYGHVHLRSRFGSRRFASSDKEIHFHTGFATYQLLSAFWDLVEPGAADVSPVTTSLLPFDELLLFLTHLSTGASLSDLSQRFGIESAAVSGVLSSWTHFLYRLLGSQRLWIPPEAVRAHLPPEFSAFSDTQVVLHCVQIFCRARVPLRLQGSAFPPGRDPASFKALVGLAPHGAVTFISSLFARSVSDLEIFRQSGVTKLLRADAAVMVDRGFLIDHVAPCKVHRPAFFYQNPKTSSKRSRTGPSMAHLKVHVRRCVASLKENQLFNKSAPLCVCGSLEELFSVACCLLNYQKRPRQNLHSWTAGSQA